MDSAKDSRERKKKTKKNPPARARRVAHLARFVAGALVSGALAPTALKVVDFGGSEIDGAGSSPRARLFRRLLLQALLSCPNAKKEKAFVVSPDPGAEGSAAAATLAPRAPRWSARGRGVRHPRAVVRERRYRKTRLGRERARSGEAGGEDTQGRAHVGEAPREPRRTCSRSFQNSCRRGRAEIHSAIVQTRGPRDRDAQTVAPAGGTVRRTEGPGRGRGARHGGIRGEGARTNACEAPPRSRVASRARRPFGAVAENEGTPSFLRLQIWRSRASPRVPSPRPRADIPVPPRFSRRRARYASATRPRRRASRAPRRTTRAASASSRTSRARSRNPWAR